MATENNKYPALAAAAGWANGYETPEEGMHLSHEDATAVDTALAQGKTDAEAIAANATTIQDLNQKVTALITQLTAKTEEADEQRALAVKYGKEDANKGTSLKTEKDTPAEEAKKPAMHPVTAQAMAALGRFRK